MPERAVRRFAVVGCGGAGRRHAQHYHGIEGVELIGCFDVDASGARALASEYGGVAYHSLDDLLDAGPDGISVCTPPDSHLGALTAAVERGIRVLVEKPLANRLADCLTVDPAGLAVCAFKFRHLTGALPLRQAIAAGELGRILAVRGTAVSDLSMKDRWFSDPAIAGGGVLADNGVHIVDLCRYLLGPVAKVAAATSGGSRQLAVEETAAVQLRMECGAVCQVAVSWEAPAPMAPLLEVYGSAGYARLGYELEVFDGKGEGPRLHVPGADVNIWREVIANFTAFASGHGEASASFADGFHALAAIDAAYRSLASDSWEAPASLAGDGDGGGSAHA